VTLAPPQPELTPAGIVQRAADIAPTLVVRQAETEERTCYAPDTHEAFREAGFYRLSSRAATAATSSTSRRSSG
jgi:3-hydroxy-9,10-secoandrosta-1,3,5(10)-triene-9,17-dione monooxygenase